MSSDKLAHPLNHSLSSAQASDLIISKARELVGKLVELRGHDKPPFLGEEFARMIGVKEIRKEDIGGVSGALIRFADGCVIKVNKEQNLVRQNFSCAHEIGHIIFDKLNMEEFISTIEYRQTFNPQILDKEKAHSRESLCDEAATELLMPEMIYKRYLLSLGTSIQSIETLAGLFQVSIQAAARRVAELNPKPCSVFVWKPVIKGDTSTLKLGWGVGPGFGNRKQAYYVPVNKSVKKPSKLHEAYFGHAPVKSMGSFKRGSDVKRMIMESKGFGFNESRYVISVVNI